MRVNAGHGGEPSRVGYAEHTGTPAVGRHVLEQPFDGIVRVGGLVDALRIPPVVQRVIHDELAFTAEAPPDVLVDKDVTVSREESIVGPDGGVACYAVGGTRDDERQRLVATARL